MRPLVAPLVAALATPLQDARGGTSAVGLTPILVDMSESFGRFTYPDVGGGQVDLAALLANPTYGGFMPSGTQEWELGTVGRAPTATTGNVTDFIFDSGANNPRTTAGFVLGNTGKTPYTTRHPAGGLSNQGVYSWQYRCRVDGGPWSNWATYERTILADGCSVGDETGNYPGALFYYYGLGSEAYTAGVRKILLPCGLSRPDLRMGGNFNFAAGTGYSSAARVKVMWANNQKPPTLSAIAWTNDSGILIDLEYDGVTVTRGRIFGANPNVNAKIQMAGSTDCKIVRCDLRNTQADYTAEYTGVNAWAAIYITGTSNLVGESGNWDMANFIEHTFYGILVDGGTTVANNSVCNIHGRHIGSLTTATSTDEIENLIGATFRTQVPVLDVGNHLDKSWTHDGTAGAVAQNSKKRNQLIFSGLSNSAARLAVFGATGTTLEVANPELRGCIIWDAYGYVAELGRWSGRARITDNDCGMLGTGDYSTAPFGAGFDHGAFGARPAIGPGAALTGGATLEHTGNVYSGSDAIASGDISAIAQAATEVGGVNVYRNRGAVVTNYVNGDPVAYLAANPPIINGVAWGAPTKKADVLAILAVFWTALRRNDGLGPVNPAGNGWKTLSA